MNEEKIKELLSRNFLTLIGNRAGFSCIRPEEDFGVDLSVCRVQQIQQNGHTRYLQTAESIDFQLKCTTVNGVEFDAAENLWKYDLAVKNFNDLIHRRHELPPLYLVLYVLPVDPDTWLQSSGDLTQLILSGRAYWYQPAEAEAPSDNAETKRIYIPAAQTVSVGFFEGLFQKTYG